MGVACSCCLPRTKQSATSSEHQPSSIRGVAVSSRPLLVDTNLEVLIPEVPIPPPIPVIQNLESGRPHADPGSAQTSLAIGGNSNQEAAVQVTNAEIQPLVPDSSTRHATMDDVDCGPPRRLSGARRVFDSNDVLAIEMANIGGAVGVTAGECIKSLEKDLKEARKDMKGKLQCEGLDSAKGIASKPEESVGWLTKEEEDDCPICLEEYIEDNPKIPTQCKHHFHLGCILEWMERSGDCPVCDQVMILTEEYTK